MADDTPQDGTTEIPADGATPDATDDLGDAGKKALESERTRAKDAERRAKALERELEQVRTANLSEAERAVAEAEQRGRVAERVEFGKRLVKSEFAGAAGRVNPDFDAAEALQYLDLSRFVGEDGEPDAKAIQAAVNRLVPVPAGTPSFDGGARRTAPATPDFNAELRRAAGRA